LFVDVGYNRLGRSVKTTDTEPVY